LIADCSDGENLSIAKFRHLAPQQNWYAPSIEFCDASQNFADSFFS